MRVPGEKGPSQPLTYLWERHKEIMRRLVAGDRQVDIARDMSMTQSRMSIICNSPAFKTQLERLSVGADSNALNVQERVTALSSDAMSILEDVLQQGDADNIPKKLQVEVAKDIMDRAGYGATKKIATVSTTLDAGDLEEMRARNAKVINAES